MTDVSETGKYDNSARAQCKRQKLTFTIHFNFNINL